MSRFEVVTRSTSGHCCFEASVVDNDKRETVCETFDVASARIIAAALNSAHDVVATWPAEIERVEAEAEAARIEHEREMERAAAEAEAEAVYWRSAEGQAELNGSTLSLEAATARLAMLHDDAVAAGLADVQRRSDEAERQLLRGDPT